MEIVCKCILNALSNAIQTDKPTEKVSYLFKKAVLSILLAPEEELKNNNSKLVMFVNVLFSLDQARIFFLSGVYSPKVLTGVISENNEIHVKAKGREEYFGSQSLKSLLHVYSNCDQLSQFVIPKVCTVYTSWRV